MMAVDRGDAPELLAKYVFEITENYIEKRKASKGYRFQWPQRETQSLYKVVYNALKEMNGAHCSYCDGFPMAATGKDQVDHFRPKSREEFYHLVVDWNNLFLICSACNTAKGEKFDELLLRPDTEGFDFHRYFCYRTDTGAIEVNSGGSKVERGRAEVTISILNLNRADACVARKREVRMLMAATEEEMDDYGYRFLQCIV